MIIRFPKSKLTPEIWNTIQDSYFSQIINYVINSDYRKSVKLTSWLNNQINNPTSSVVNILKEIPNSSDEDKQIIEILKWVKNNIKYVKDSDVWKMPEYWQTADETITLKTGDCEDGAILIYVLARLKDIPKERLLLLCGDVNGGGHCWLGYKPSDCPLNFAFIDWCYWYKGTSIINRNLFFIDKSKIYEYKPDNTLINSNYYTIWFGFNEEQSYKVLDFKAKILNS